MEFKYQFLDGDEALMGVALLGELLDNSPSK